MDWTVPCICLGVSVIVLSEVIKEKRAIKLNYVLKTDIHNIII